MRGFQTLAYLLLGAAAYASPVAEDGRVLSIFSVVNFPNVQCDATVNQEGGALSGLKGTCLSSTECSDQGGEHKGNCAAGFGVCCITRLTACGGTVSHNNTYIESADYPTVLTAGTVSNCAYTIQRQGEICQLRLDFQDVTLTTGTNGLTDNTAGRIVAAGASGIEPPAVNGAITGDHMFVEVRDMDPTITVTTVAGTTGQKWQIQVSQIACTSPYKAPVGCTQYFLENSGTIRSYNTRDAAAMQELTGQSNRICIRQNEGMCGVMFTAADGAFNVGMAAPNANAMAGSTGNTCNTLTNWVVIPGAGVFCENVLNTVEDATVNAPVTVKNGPVSLTHLTNAAAVAGASGFVINYSQI